MSCQHCYLTDSEHKFVCDCGHKHQDHVFASGCLVRITPDTLCSCNQYSQHKQILNKEK